MLSDASSLTATILGVIPDAWVAALPLWLHQLQSALLDTLATLGLVGQVDGQPAWPWPQRLAIETLAIDAGLARRVLATLLLAAILLTVAVVVVPIARVAFRRRLASRWAVAPNRHAKRAGTLVTLGLAAMPALALALVLPWQSTGLLLRPAMPTSFHVAPAGASAQSLASGLATYQAQCASCHGADGRGETPRAASLPVWPPRLTGSLLWRRADGELYGHIRHGLLARDGRQTMPGFATQLSVEETWAVLGALRLLAGGQALKEQGQWPWPVAAPDFAADCGAAGRRSLSGWRGQRVMIAVVADGAEWPRPDPRYETVVLVADPGGIRAGGGAVGARGDDGDDGEEGDPADRVARDGDSAAVVPGKVTTAAPQGCRVLHPDALWQALSTVAQGNDATLAGLQVLVDRDGWLRARGRPETAGWRDEDLVCRTMMAEPVAVAVAVSSPQVSPRVSPQSSPQSSQQPGAVPVLVPGGDGLDRLIQRIDADPIASGRSYIAAHGRNVR